MLSYGVVRGELTALLWGAALLGITVYSFLAVFFAFLFRAGDPVYCELESRSLRVGEKTTARFDFVRRLPVPGVRVAAELVLRTKDDRALCLYGNAALSGSVTIAANERGCFETGGPALVAADLFGFFSMRRPPATGAAIRLAVHPVPGNGARATETGRGGGELRNPEAREKTQDLYENRAYYPGDDARRINWKLLGHSGELFVRDGSREPPPRSVLNVVACAAYDGALFSKREALIVSDVIAAQALGFSIRCRRAGYEVRCGIAGGSFFLGESAPEVASASLSVGLIGDELDFPPIPEGEPVIVFIPPRSGTLTGALERFLNSGREEASSCTVFVVSGFDPGMKAKRRSGLLSAARESAARIRGEWGVDAGLIDE